MDNPFLDYFNSISSKLTARTTEFSYRTDLENLLNTIKNNKSIKVIQESSKEKDEIGRPDFQVKISEAMLGHIETKKITDNLDNFIKTEQIEKYGKIIIDETLFEIANKNLDNFAVLRVDSIFSEFFATKPKLIEKPESLSEILAIQAKNFKYLITEYLKTEKDLTFKSRLLGLVLEPDDIPESISWKVQNIIDILNNVDYEKLHKELLFSKMKEFQEQDPYIYFYEHFLSSYDKSKRVEKGVFYTPLPVVHFIVKSVKSVLKDQFSKSGFADAGITVLDFAAGTGTFYLETFKEALNEVDKALKNEFIRKNLLKNFYGFEFLIAPYTIAHLKLSQYLEEQGDHFVVADNENELKDRINFFMKKSSKEITNTLKLEDSKYWNIESAKNELKRINIEEYIRNYTMKVFDNHKIFYHPAGKFEVVNPILIKNKLHINPKQFFDNVPEEVYNFEIGGYQVIEKYLKARKNKYLTLDEINHLKKVIISLELTIQQMKKIDKETKDWI
ncbi:unnamed protein product [Rotaria sp. Silwood1]|nr:unnamed protein product [Rotaria sp. Silwood1]